MVMCKAIADGQGSCNSREFDGENSQWPCSIAHLHAPEEPNSPHPSDLREVINAPKSDHSFNTEHGMIYPPGIQEILIPLGA